MSEALAWVSRSSRPLARLTEHYLVHLESPAALRTKILEREASEQIARMEVRMNWLATVASVSTLLGLLGTVTGLVSAFHQIERSGGTVQPSDLASGIWEALITTVFGLLVAIPTLAAYHLLDHQAGRMALKMEWLVAYLDEWTHGSTTDSSTEGQR
jgi:biopolymer transport protein ExbB